MCLYLDDGCEARVRLTLALSGQINCLFCIDFYMLTIYHFWKKDKVWQYFSVYFYHPSYDIQCLKKKKTARDTYHLKSVAVIKLSAVLCVCLCWGFYAVSTAFQSYNGGQLTYPHCSWTGFSLSKRLTSTQCTYFRQNLTYALLESAEGGEWQ